MYLMCKRGDVRRGAVGPEASCSYTMFKVAGVLRDI